MANTLPNSTKTEDAVIASCLLFEENVDKAISKLSPNDFYDPKNQDVWRQIENLHSEGRPIEQHTIEDKVGEEVYYDMTQTSTDVEGDAGVIKQYSQLRTIIKTCNQASSQAASKQNPQDVLATLNSLFEETSDSNIVSIGDAMIDAVERNMKVADGDITLGVKAGLDVDDKIGGYEDGKLYIIAARPAMGKAQTMDSKVLMRDGSYKEMRNIQIGDNLASYDGKVSIVEGIFPQGKKNVYELSFTDGRTVKASADHLWKVGNRRWKADKVVTTDKLIEYLSMPSYKNRIWVDLISGDFGCDNDLPIDPYVLGVLLGDGGMSSETLGLSNSNIDIVREFRDRSGVEIKISQRSATRVDWRINSPEMRDKLRELGLWGKKSLTKFIPKQYLSSTKHSRVRLLQGLMDTDGWAEKSGACLYSSSSKDLINDFIDLIRSLGGVAKYKEHYPRYNGSDGSRVDGNTSYRTSVRFNDNSFVFKHYKLKERASDRNRNGVRLKIQSIEKVGKEECQCIKVSHHKSCYITDNYINTHNTAYALHVMREVAGTGIPVGMMSLEMTGMGLANRLLINAMDVDGMKIRSGNISQKEKNIMMDAAGEVSNLPIHFDDNPIMTAGGLRAKANILRRRYGIGLLVIDYLQLMSGNGSHGTREQEVSEISRTCKLVAKELKIPVIALSQLSRKVENRNIKRPQLADLRESGAIEQDADCVQFLYRPSQYGRQQYPSGDIFSGSTTNICEIIVSKNRDGKTGVEQQLFFANKMRFENLNHKHT